MVTALEGWSFDGVKGKMTIRADDHALLQPMFQAKLAGSGDRRSRRRWPRRSPPEDDRTARRWPMKG